MFTFELDAAEINLKALKHIAGFKLDKHGCPICNQNIQFCFLSDDMIGWAVECQSCKYAGPFCSNPQTAIDEFLLVQ